MSQEIVSKKIVQVLQNIGKGISDSKGEAAKQQGGMAGLPLYAFYKMGKKSTSINITPDGVKNLDTQSLMNNTMVDQLNKKKTLLGG